MTHEEYLKLAQLLRPGISHSLGVRNITLLVTCDAWLLTLDIRLL
jgi:hypothetical protein